MFGDELPLNASVNFTGYARRISRKALLFGVVSHLFLWLLMLSLVYFKLLDLSVPNLDFANKTSDNLLEVIDFGKIPTGSPRLSVPVKGQDAAAMLTKSLAEAANLTQDERFRQWQKLQNMTGSVSNRSVDEIAGLLNFSSTRYQPKKNAPEGKFNFSSAALQDIRKASDSRGRDGFKIVMVDEAGRSYSFSVFGKEAEKFKSFHNIFKFTHNNPVFGAIYHKMIKPLVADMFKQQQLSRKKK